ncbi:nickel/cobalt transporter [Burkholderia sp. L27(2015)]|uniref:nickel/cobalt transporter n=1 Tax=Burkholderia sp. L27(2015) TaxID=1641858 RepID=UPI00131E3E9D|nr:sulfite exporter TauE/SafE family protein [Burkholderia sp. L27(2015)]
MKKRLRLLLLRFGYRGGRIRSCMSGGMLACWITCMLVLPQSAHATDVFGRSDDGSAAVQEAPAHAWAMPQPLRELLVKGIEIQGVLNEKLADALEDVRDGANPWARWIIILAAFTYGILHALGPGHGKLGVAAYLASHRARVAHAAWLSAWAALAQALSAIFLVLAFGQFFHRELNTVLTRAADLELASYIALFAVGAWTLWSVGTRRDCCDISTRMQWPDAARSRELDADADAATDGDGGAALRPGTYLAHAMRPAAVRLSRRPVVQSARSSARSQASGRVWIVRQIFFTGLALGIRPCAGALFVLLSALAYGVFLTGVLAALAMAVGVALTVLLIALASLGVNRALTSRAQRRGQSVERVRRVLALSGAVFIVGFAGLQSFLLLAGMVAPSLS